MIQVLRTGVDIIETDRIKEIRPEIRERFLNRVYTENELFLFRENYASLAGRFAAKEAVAKALGTGIGAVHWKDIEILKGEEGEPLLFLYNQAKKQSDLLGIELWSISISHSKTTAIAYVVGIG